MQEHRDGEAIVRLFLTLLNIPTCTLRVPCFSRAADQHEVYGDVCQMADSVNNPQKDKNSGTGCVRKVEKTRVDSTFNVHRTEDSSCPCTKNIRDSEEADRFLLHERQVVVKHSGRVPEFTPASNQNVATKDTSLMDSVVPESDADGDTETAQAPPQILSKSQNLKHQNAEEKCKQTQHLRTAPASQEEEAEIQTKDCAEHKMTGHLHHTDVEVRNEGDASSGNDKNLNSKLQRWTRFQSQRRPSAKCQQADLAELSQQPRDNLDTSVQMERTESINLKRMTRHSEKRQENPQSSPEQDSSSVSSSVARMTVQANQFNATVCRRTEETDMTLRKVTSSIARQHLRSASKGQTGDVTQCPVCGKTIRSSRALQLHRKACQGDKSLKSKEGLSVCLSVCLCVYI